MDPAEENRLLRAALRTTAQCLEDVVAAESVAPPAPWGWDWERVLQEARALS